MSEHKVRAWKSKGLLETAEWLKGKESLLEAQGKVAEKKVCFDCGKKITTRYMIMGKPYCEDCYMAL